MGAGAWPSSDHDQKSMRMKLYQRQWMRSTFLIVMGGPQSPDEDREAFPYYDPQAEIELIQKAMKADRYIVGVCLGAQLLSVAYGAEYEHSPEREIGVFSITLTEAGLKDNHVKVFGPTLNTGHWHGDMPGLTEDAVVLCDQSRLSTSNYSLYVLNTMPSKLIWNLIQKQ